MQLGHFDFLSSVQELSTDAGGTAVGASATFNGQTYNLAFGVTVDGPVSTYGKPSPSLFRAVASSDEAGTLNVQQSPDGKNWFITDTGTITAGFGTKSVVVESKIVMPFVRAQIVNGSSAQTEVEFDTTLVSI